MTTVDTVDEKAIRLFQTSVLAMANDPSYEDSAFRRSMREVIRRMFERHSALRAEFGRLAYVLDSADDPQAVKLMELLGAMGFYCSTRAAMFADLLRLVGEAKIDLDLVRNNALAEKMKSLHPAIPRMAPDGWRIARLWGNGAHYVKPLLAEPETFLQCIFTADDIDHGRSSGGPSLVKWLHLSVSTPTRMPVWDEIVATKRAFMGDRRAVMVVPERDKHVNDHPYCMHLWATERAEDDPLPDFTALV